MLAIPCAASTRRSRGPCRGRARSGSSSRRGPRRRRRRHAGSRRWRRRTTPCAAWHCSVAKSRYAVPGPPGRQVRREVRIELRRLEQERLRVEDVAELVRVTRRRVAVVVGLDLRRAARKRPDRPGRSTSTCSPRPCSGRWCRSSAGRTRRVVQDLVAACRTSLMPPRRNSTVSDRELLIGRARGRHQAHVVHQVVEAGSRRSGAGARAGVREEVGPRQRHAARPLREDHLAARPDADRRSPARPERPRPGRRPPRGSRPRIRVAEHPRRVPDRLAQRRIRIVRVRFVDEVGARDDRRRRRRPPAASPSARPASAFGRRARDTRHRRQEAVRVELEALERAAPDRPSSTGRRSGFRWLGMTAPI